MNLLKKLALSVFGPQFGEKGGQQMRSLPVAGVGARPQFVKSTLFGQQVGHSASGESIAGVGARLQFVKSTLFSQQVGQPFAGLAIAASFKVCVCSSPQLVETTILGK
jgi:hypothetical protein